MIDDDNVELSHLTINEKEFEILPRVVEKAKAKWKRSAAGPDSTSVIEVQRMSNETLAALYNIVLRTANIPDSFRESRIILIHKEGDPTNPANYRPLSIASAL